MVTHNFATDQKVQRFPLTLADEARLCYQATHLFQGNWKEVQERFRTQFSKIKNTREQQLFHAWIPFHFEEYAEIIDAYI